MKNIAWLAIGFLTSVVFADDQAKWKLEVRQQSQKIVSVQWQKEGEVEIAALSDQLYQAVIASPKRLKRASTRGIDHALVVIEEGNGMTPGVYVLTPGKLTEDVTLKVVPVSSYLTPTGFAYEYYNEKNNTFEVAYFSLETGKSTVVVKDIAAEDREPPAKVKINYADDGVTVVRGTVQTTYPLAGGVSRPLAVVRDLSPAAKEVLSTYEAKDLTEAVTAEGLITSDWLESTAQAIERNFFSENRERRSAILVGKTRRIGVAYLIAQRIAEGKVKPLEGWKVYRVNPSQFSAGGYTGADVTKVTSLFSAIKGQKVILVIDGIEDLLALGDSSDEQRRKVGAAMASYVGEGQVLMIATATNGGLTRLQEDPEFVKGFKIERVEEPNQAEIQAFMKERIKLLEMRYPGVKIAENADATLTTNIWRHLDEEAQPEIEITALHDLYSEAAASDSKVITREAARAWVGKTSGRFSLTNGKLREFTRPEVFFEAMKAVIGHKRPLETVRSLLSQIANGDLSDDFEERRGQGLRNLFFLGPSGVGKTFIVQELQRQMEKYGVKWNVLLINGNEYGEEDKVNKLIGSAAGYVNSDEEFLYARVKQLREGFLFFDEYDKQHPALSKFMMNILDVGAVPLGKREGVRALHRGITFMASNFGSKGYKQDMLATPEEQEVATLTDEFTLNYTSDYTFRKPDKKKIEKYCHDLDGTPWTKPKEGDEDAKQALVEKLRDVLVRHYGSIGRLVNNQDLRRIGNFELLPHWTRAQYLQFMNVQLGRVAKNAVKEGKAASLTFDQGFKDWLFRETWGEGGIRVFSWGAGALIDYELYTGKVVNFVSEYGQDAKNAGKKWEMYMKDGTPAIRWLEA